MSNYIVDGADLTSVADAIRAKSGGSSQLAFPAGFVSEIQAIPSGSSGPQWEKIGEKTVTLTEYTNTSTAETTDTGLDITNSDFAFMLAVITCDAAITTTSEWSMTVHLFGRTVPSGNTNTGQATMEKGVATLSFAALSSSSFSTNSYGVYVLNGKGTIQINRKCHATACPKCRAGNYTVKVYGLKSL